MKRFGIFFNGLALLFLGMVFASTAMDFDQEKKKDKRGTEGVDIIGLGESPKKHKPQLLLSFADRNNNFDQSIFVPGTLYGFLSDSDAELYGRQNNYILDVGQIVLIKIKENGWKLARIKKILGKNEIRVKTIDKLSKGKYNPNDESVKVLRPWYQCLWQPGVSKIWFDESLLKAFPTSSISLKPFFQGFIIPEKSRIAFIGDLHGEVEALQHNLSELFSKKFFDSDLKLFPDHYIVFLGDYGDRGKTGAEIYYILSQLKIMNPDQLFILRGNHEDIMWMNDTKHGGLYQEVVKKYDKDSWTIITHIFESLPSMLLVGLNTLSTNYYNFVMFAHGAIDPKLDLKNHLKTIIQNKVYSADLTEHNDVSIRWLDLRGDDNKCMYRDKETKQLKYATTPQKSRVIPTTDGRKAANMSLLREYFDSNARMIDWQDDVQFELACLIRGHDHQVPNGAARLIDAEPLSWKSLNSGHTYQVEKTAYTFISCLLGSVEPIYNYTYGILDAAVNGRWYLTAFISPSPNVYVPTTNMTVSSSSSGKNISQPIKITPPNDDDDDK